MKKMKMRIEFKFQIKKEMTNDNSEYKCSRKRRFVLYLRYGNVEIKKQTQIFGTIAKPVDVELLIKAIYGLVEYNRHGSAK